MNSIGPIISTIWLKIKKINPYKIKKVFPPETPQDTFQKKLDKKA